VNPNALNWQHLNAALQAVTAALAAAGYRVDTYLECSQFFGHTLTDFHVIAGNGRN
jgi:hypothetical protein